MKKKFDSVMLADGIEMTTDSAETLINNNVLVVGGSGSGKTVSYVLPRLMGMESESSLIVTTTKEMIRKLTENMLHKRGYNILILNWVDGEKSNVYWNPLSKENIQSFDDITKLATDIVLSNIEREHATDVFWNEAAISMLCAIIGYVYCVKSKPYMKDVIELFRKLKVLNRDSDIVETSLDNMFQRFENKAGNQHYVCSCWRTAAEQPPRTFRCILGSLAVTMDKIFTEQVLAMMLPTEGKKELQISELGKKKTVLFLNTSPVNSSLHCLINIFYGSVFKVLFEEAMRKENEMLDIPVHLAADDFACGCPIPGFENYISIIRAANISVSLLIQSEAQLDDIYGESKSRTIIDNCDTYLYMGGMDRTTAKNIGERIDRPTSEILSMEVGKMVIMQRGHAPVVFAERYKTLEDERYKKMLGNFERKLHEENLKKSYSQDT